MKIALWLALSQGLHSAVDGFTLPPPKSQSSGSWTSQSQKSWERLKPLYASDGDEELQQPKVPVPPTPPSPDMEIVKEKLIEADEAPTSESEGDEAPTSEEEIEAQRPKIEAAAKTVKKAAPPPTIPKMEPPKPTVQLSAEDQKNVGAAGIGGAVLGLVLGSILVLEIPDLDMVMEPLLWPIVISLTFATGGFVGGSSEGKVGEIIRGSLGRATRALGKVLKNVANAAIQAAAQAVQNKVKETGDEIKAIPSKVASAAKEKVDGTVDEISQIPTRVKDAAIKKTGEVVEEVKATPGRIATSTKKAVEDAVDDTIDAVEKTVEEVVSIPKKAAEAVEKQVESIIGPSGPVKPQPPKSPPPLPTSSGAPPKSQPSALKDIPKPSIPKIEVPKFDPPKIEPPKLDIPKIEVPKFEVPKVSIPTPKSATPKPVQVSQPKKKDASSEILDIQRAVKLATEATRKEKAALAKGGESSSDVDQKAAQAAEKAKQRDEAKKEAAIRKKEAAMKAAEAKAQREEEQARKQAEAAAAKRQREEEIARKNAEKEAAAAASKAKLDAVKQKQAQAAQQSLKAAAPRRTVSLGDLFSLGKVESEPESSPPPSKTPTVSRAPKGVPTISNWKQNSDGSISGRITGSPNFNEGESVTTSPVANGATSGSVVTTGSGSKYFLGAKGGFSFPFSSPPQSAVPAVSTPKVDKAAEARRAAEERKAAQQAANEERRRRAEEAKAKQAEMAEKRRQAAEEAQAAQAAAAEKRRLAAEEAKAKQAAMVEERRRLSEEKKAAQAAAAEERKVAAEEKKAAQAAAAEKRRRAAEEKKAAQAAAAEERRVAAEKKKAAQATASKAASPAPAPKRPTFQLPKFEPPVPAPRPSLQLPKKAAAPAPAPRRPTLQLPKVAPAPTKATSSATARAPRGVPEIRSWTMKRDGGISGRIFGSPNFSDGEFVETSPIANGKIENGSVVSTSSGSRYFLSADAAAKKANIAAAFKGMSGAKPGSTISLTKQMKANTAAPESVAKRAPSKKSQRIEAKPRATFSLFGLGGASNEDDTAAKSESPRPSRPIPPKKAPRGVPSMSRWKKNADGSITGLISGSPAFAEGERITTSPIARGNVAKGEVVTTGSGSRYFLS